MLCVNSYKSFHPKKLLNLLYDLYPTIFTFGMCIDGMPELNHLVMEAAQTDGRLARHPLQDRIKEIQAHKMLSSLFIQLIGEHNATITVNIKGLNLIYCLLLVTG